MELGMDLGIWNLSRDTGINLFHITNLVWLLQEDQEMHVRKTTLLVFNGVDKAVTITNLFKQGLLFAMENPCDQLRPNHSSLTYVCMVVRWWPNIIRNKQTWKQILSDLWPASIGSHGEEKVRFSIFTTNSQRVLKELLHIARPTLVSGGKKNTSNLSHVLNTILTHAVSQLRSARSLVWLLAAQVRLH